MMTAISQEALEEIIEKHALWLQGDPRGKQMSLQILSQESLVQDELRTTQSTYFRLCH